MLLLNVAAQFTYNRERDFNLSSYMEEEIPEETDMDLEPQEAQAAEPAGRTGLSDVDNGQLAYRSYTCSLGQSLNPPEFDWSCKQLTVSFPWLSFLSVL